MAVDPRKYVDNDKRFPEDLSGQTGKVLIVNAGETAYELQTQAGSSITGSILIWPFDTLPAGYIPMGATYDYDTYPALGALFGSTPGNTFDVPAVNFMKNSNGTDTGTLEEGSVGTHGHVADAVANHSHSVSVNSVGNHTHSVSAAGYTNANYSSPTTTVANDVASTSGAAGAHGHTASIGENGGHTPVIQDHVGVTQPSCTLLNFGIKT